MYIYMYIPAENFDCANSKMMVHSVDCQKTEEKGEIENQSTGAVSIHVYIHVAI